MRISASGWLLAAASAAAVIALAPAAPSLGSDLTGSSFPDAAVAVGSLVVLGLACWSLVVTVAVVLGTSSRIVTVIAPVALRRALLAGAAGALTIAPAHADQAAPAPPPHVVTGLSLPDRPDSPDSPDSPESRESPAAPHRTAASATATVPRASADGVRVRPGDTLWAIAARSLPAGASDADIAAATAAWHRANLDVIGDDPDLIKPAQLLVPPSPKESS